MIFCDKCPAPAGMIPDKAEDAEDIWQMPRTCGDDPPADLHKRNK